MAASVAANRALDARPPAFLPWLLTGALVGVLFLLAAQLEPKWFVVLFLGGLTVAASLAVSDRKAFYLGLLVFTIPITVDLHLYFRPSTVHHSTHGIVVALHHLPLAALYLIWAARLLATRAGPGVSGRGLAPLAAFFGAAAASVLLGGAPLFGAFDLVALLASVVLFVYASSQITTRRDLHVVLAALLATTAVQGGIAIGQHVTRSSLGLEFLGAYSRTLEGLAVLTRVGGTVGHPNALALYFDLVLPPAIALLFAPLRGRTRLLLGIAVSLGLVGLVLTLSRGGIVATGAAGLLLVFLWLKRVGFLRALLASLLAVALLLALLLGTPNPVQRRLLREEYPAALARIPLSHVARNMIADRPLLGVGLNNYASVAPRYDTTPERVTSWWNAPVHNQILYIAAETGLVGLLFFLLFLLAVLRALRPAIRAPDPFVAWTAVGVAVGVGAFLAHLQIEFDSLTRNSLFWFLSGLAVSLGRLAGASSRPPS